MHRLLHQNFQIYYPLSSRARLRDVQRPRQRREDELVPVRASAHPRVRGSVRANRQAGTPPLRGGRCPLAAITDPGGRRRRDGVPLESMRHGTSLGALAGKTRRDRHAQPVSSALASPQLGSQMLAVVPAPGSDSK